MLKPTMKWNGDPDFEFKIEGFSDASHAPNPDDRRSVNASAVFLCGAPVVMKSQGQKIMTLSSTKA